MVGGWSPLHLHITYDVINALGITLKQQEMCNRLWEFYHNRVCNAPMEVLCKSWLFCRISATVEKELCPQSAVKQSKSVPCLNGSQSINPHIRTTFCASVSLLTDRGYAAFWTFLNAFQLKKTCSFSGACKSDKKLDAVCCQHLRRFFKIRKTSLTVDTKPTKSTDLERHVFVSK